MSAVVFGAPGLVVLTTPSLKAAELRWVASQGRTEHVGRTANELMQALNECAALPWHFNVKPLRSEADDAAFRKELLAVRDYIAAAKTITSGEAGNEAVSIARSVDAALADSLQRSRERAGKTVSELDLAMRFLLEEEDPSGEIEQTFGLKVPPDSTNGDPLDFDFR